MTKDADEALVLVERQPEQRTALVRLNRPKQLNALNGPTMDALCAALEELDRDDAVRAMVVTGSDRAFAAGADIAEMAGASPIDMLRGNRIAQWDRVRRIIGTIAAVIAHEFNNLLTPIVSYSQFALASAESESPDLALIKKALAKAFQSSTKAGKICASMLALARGLVSRVVPVELVVEDALSLGAAIATKSPLALRLAKESVNAAYEMSLTDGLAHERRLFYLLFASEDQKEGMAAFLEKRTPDFTGR